MFQEAPAVFAIRIDDDPETSVDGAGPHPGDVLAWGLAWATTAVTFDGHTLGHFSSADSAADIYSFAYPIYLDWPNGDAG